MNKPRFALILFLGLISFLYTSAQKQDTIFYKEGRESIGLQTRYSIDKNLFISTAFKWPEKEFKESEKAILSLQYQCDPLWITFQVQNQSKKDAIILEVDNPQLDSASLFQWNKDGKLIPLALGGDRVYKGNSLSRFKPVFGLDISPGQTVQYLLRIRSLEPLIVPLYISNKDAFFLSSQARHLVFACYIGIMLVMFLYNTFLYITIKDRSYLYYILYIIFIAAAQATLGNYIQVITCTWTPAINHFGIALFSFLAGIFAILFAIQFLELKKNMRKAFYGLIAFAILYCIAFIFYLIHQPQITYKIYDIAGGLVSIYTLIFSAILAIKGQRTAKFFLVAWVFFIAGLITYVCKNLGILESNLFTDHSLHFGSGIEAVVLSIALADKINVLKKEKEQAQARALNMSIENEKIIRDQNMLLEKEVEARTTELKQINANLEDTLEQLKDAQSQLVESEKMASLGQLTAGVAHEINNPINFVSSNIKPLKRDINELLQLIKTLEEEIPLPLKEKILTIKEDIEYDLIVEEINLLLKGIEDGANRTVDIVKGLKNFSRLDEHEYKSANVIEGIESTLILLNNNLGGQITLIREFSNIPDIECYPGKLNQVFMNILSNACYAIHKKFGNQPGGIIKIKADIEKDMLQICFEDNGIGIPPEKLNKIFDPFYTTKDVGEGTGLGLSIVYNIIQLHKGKINVESEPNNFTKIMISIPQIIS
jgi:signal transduction histidine kinase